MELYVFHSALFGSPRIITTNIVASIEALEALANHDNKYPPENRWKLQPVRYYPTPSDSYLEKLSDLEV